jgi:16S rRNA (uracil1498-N3)-methyltransferase
MNLPFFYIENFQQEQKTVILDESTSKHIVQVLRMKEGKSLNLTDGKGNLLTAEIVVTNKKHCEVAIRGTRHEAQGTRKVSIGISLIKNSSRFEWFLEKATELGINEIIPMICERTEKEKFRKDRMQNVMISAMLQSQQCWLPVLQEPVEYKKVMERSSQQQKFIAHCLEQEKRNLSDVINENLSSQIILIGPEGDFTREEVDLALQHHFIAVTLGETRLRAETAGIAAATLLRLV